MSRLIQERAALVQRIETIKRTLTAMSSMFGEHIFSARLLELMGRKALQRQRGRTEACRQLLLEANGPLRAVEICDLLAKMDAHLLDHHKQPMASVATVMGRLVAYDEARAVHINGDRAWESVGSLKPAGRS